MPISRRSACRPARERSTRQPSNKISPLSGTSRPLMQRSRVVLPEPLRPMMATTSPVSMVIETSSSATCVPKRLEMPFNAKIGIDAPFKISGQERKRPAHREVERRHQWIDDHGLERHIHDELSSASQLDKTNDGGDRGVLDELYQEAHGRWDRNPHRLRQYNKTKLLEV